MRRKNKCNSDALESSPSSLVSMSLPKQLNHIFNLDKMGNKHFRDEKNTSEKKNYCRSYSKKFIQAMSQLECAHCYLMEPMKLDKYNLPMIARCGHFISEKCYVEELRAPTDFYCKICSERAGVPQSISITGEDKPIRDKVLSDFFEAIEEGGFRCTDCKDLHDPTNIVQFSGWSESIYLCVWCASENDRQEVEKKKASHKLDLELTATSSERERLVSLNRIDHVSGWALDACCCCRKKLRDKNDKEIIVMSCGHISHKECRMTNFRPTSNAYMVPKGELPWDVQCLFCAGEGEPVLSSRSVPYTTWNGKHYLEGYTEEEYKECRVCKQEHPESNFPPQDPSLLPKRQKLSGKCVWCTVESFGPKTE